MTEKQTLNRKSESSNMMEVKLHPHLVGAISKVKDCEGQEHIAASTLATMYEPVKGEEEDTFNAEQYYDFIRHRVAVIGMFSSRRVDTDEFTNVHYSSKSDELEFGYLKGSPTYDYYYPHDRITYHVDNSWMFSCYQIQFQTEKRMFLHENTNFPSVVNVIRSSGSVQKGIIFPEEGFILRSPKNKSNEDESNIKFKIKVKVHFSIDNPDATDKLECNYNKFIYLEDFIKHNPDFKTIELKNPLTELEKLDTSDPIRKDVVSKIKSNYQDWYHNELIATLKDFPEITVKEL